MMALAIFTEDLGTGSTVPLIPDRARLSRWALLGER
jgi:hypothetical protein